MINSDALIKEQEYKPSAYFSIREIDVKPVEVTSSKIEVNVTAYIYHGEGEAKNPIMLIRAINSNIFSKIESGKEWELRPQDTVI